MDEAVQVLVVEDEDDIRNLVVMNLKRAGFDVLEAPDGQTALDLAASHRPPVILLDRMLPDISGTEICARLRGRDANADAFVIMVTALGEEDDRISGFEVGADDYVPKPFSVKELVLRIKAGARRVSRTQTEEPAGEANFGDLRIDISAHRAWVSDSELDLTATEYRLLNYLASHNGQMCSRGELLEKVWELPPSLNTRTVDTHVKRLRQKLGSAADLVETVRGAGYRFRRFDS
jgi:two-component system phosphate regulon response regulator PhoB